MNEKNEVYRQCKCGGIVYSEPCAKCGSDETQALEELHDGLLSEHSGLFEKSLRENHERMIEEALGGK